LYNKKEIKKTKAINWRIYIPDKLKAPMHTLLKVNESDTFENQGKLSKENETNKTITRRHRPINNGS